MERERILVVGGGTMGAGIAGVCALAGHPTALFEADAARRAGLSDRIAGSWKRAVERGRLPAGRAETARGLLAFPDGIAEAGPAAIAIEAGPEDLDLKRRVFADLDRLLPGAALLATNTSALSVTEIAAATSAPERVLGLHFFNPVAAMPLVEVVRGRGTSAAAVARAAAFAASLGKQPVVVADAPGFATSRLGVAIGLEAMRMVEEGVASPADIDKAMELGYGHRMGPLKTSDFVGLDVRLAIAETLARGIDRRRFDPPAILRRLVAEGRIGKKSGRGFYRWEGEEALPSDPAGES